MSDSLRPHESQHARPPCPSPTPRVHSLLEKCKSKLQWDITSHLSEWPSSKSLQTINAGEGVEKRKPSCAVDGTVNWSNHYRRWYGDSIHIPWGNQNWKRHMHSVLLAALFTIARTWKQPRCPSTDEWIQKSWYIYTMEYYSTIKRNAFESFLMR